MYEVTKKLAMFHQQDKARQETPKRWIFHETDFTEQDLNEIKETRQLIAQALKAANGKIWEEAMQALCEIVPGTFIGFQMQDRIIARCRKNGITFQ